MQKKPKTDVVWYLLYVQTLQNMRLRNSFDLMIWFNDGSFWSLVSFSPWVKLTSGKITYVLFVMLNDCSNRPNMWCLKERVFNHIQCCRVIKAKSLQDFILMTFTLFILVLPSTFWMNKPNDLVFIHYAKQAVCTQMFQVLVQRMVSTTYRERTRSQFLPP